MAFQLTAEDLGFEQNPSCLESTEKIKLNGFEFPKYLPDPVFKDDQDYVYTSDQVENSDIIQSLLPCYHTQEHCIIIPHSQIPPPQTFWSVDTSDMNTIQEGIQSTKNTLQVLERRLQQAKARNDNEQIEQIQNEINNNLDNIIALTVISHSDNEERINPTSINIIYCKEIEQFISILMNKAQSNSIQDTQSLEKDLTTLQLALNEYYENCCHETEYQLKKEYYTLLLKYTSYFYFYVCCIIPPIPRFSSRDSFLHKMAETIQLPSIQRIKRDGTFNCFTDANFDPNTFTSGILDNNGKEGQGMDVDMCIKMLAMYLETLESDLRDVVLQNQDTLFKQISDIKELRTEYSAIDKRVQSITSSFELIKSEVNNSCKTINENAVRLANFNAVISLLRAITSFRLGIKKIKGFLVDENPTQRAWLRAQKTYQEIEKLYNENHLTNIQCLTEDIVYYNEIRNEIVKHITKK